MPENISKITNNDQKHYTVITTCDSENLINNINQILTNIQNQGRKVNQFDYKIIRKNKYQINFQLKSKIDKDHFYELVDIIGDAGPRPNFSEYDYNLENIIEEVINHIYSDILLYAYKNTCSKKYNNIIAVLNQLNINKTANNVETNYKNCTKQQINKILNKEFPKEYKLTLKDDDCKTYLLRYLIAQEFIKALPNISNNSIQKTYIAVTEEESFYSYIVANNIINKRR